MRGYDLWDEATVSAMPGEILSALADEAAGRSEWWRPWLALRQTGERDYCEIGGTTEVTVNSEGRLDRRWGTAHFISRTTAVEPDRRLAVEYVHGDFRGVGEWILEPVDQAHTRIGFRWRVRPAGIMRVIARFVDVPASHSAVMRHGFSAIERYVAGRRALSAR